MQQEHAKPKVISALIESRIRSFKSLIGKLEQLIVAAVANSPPLKRAVAALMEVRGVGLLPPPPYWPRCPNSARATSTRLPHRGAGTLHVVPDRHPAQRDPL